MLLYHESVGLSKDAPTDLISTLPGTDAASLLTFFVGRLAAAVTVAEGGRFELLESIFGTNNREQNTRDGFQDDKKMFKNQRRMNTIFFVEL